MRVFSVRRGDVRGRAPFTAGVLAALLLISFGTGCSRSRGAPRPAPTTTGTFRPPSLQLPGVPAPAALPATRALHLFYTSNVVGDLEPCG